MNLYVDIGCGQHRNIDGGYPEKQQLPGCSGKAIPGKAVNAHKLLHGASPLPLFFLSLDHRLHPAEIKDLHAQIVDVREQVSNGGIKGFIQPLNKSVPDGVYDILANVLESAAQGISQTRQDIA